MQSDPYSPCGCKATLTAEGDQRASLWKQLFGEPSFPIVWPLYHFSVNFPGKRFLNGDVNALDHQQKSALISAMALKFGIGTKEVEESLGERILPILDEDATVQFCAKHSRLMSQV